jgi:hypothetical protein
MAVRYGIVDQIHIDYLPGQFTSLGAVVEEFHRLATVPWDQDPNLAPCTSWRTCGRIWTAGEYKVPGRGARWLDDIWEEVKANGVTWSGGLADTSAT